MRGSTLDAAWTFSHDLNGKKIEPPKCRICGGSGKIAKGWTSCPVCGGSGTIKIKKGFVDIKTKCTACSGRGKWESGGAKCVACDGDGRETDWHRKAVETAKVTGHTFIVPSAGRK